LFEYIVPINEDPTYKICHVGPFWTPEHLTCVLWSGNTADETSPGSYNLQDGQAGHENKSFGFDTTSLTTKSNCVLIQCSKI